MIDNSRGGASLESLVPRHKFVEHPQAERHLAFVDAKNAAFDQKGYFQGQMDKYATRMKKLQKQVEADMATINSSSATASMTSADKNAARR